MVDYEYILFCYNVLRSGKLMKVDIDRLNVSKTLLTSIPKSQYSEEDKLAIYRISYIESSLAKK